MTAPGVLFIRAFHLSVRRGRHPVPTGLFLRDSSRQRWWESEERMAHPPRSLGVLLQRCPYEGIFHFPTPSWHSPLLHSVSCRQSVPFLCLVGPTHVPDTIAHCVLSQPEVSLNMPSWLCLLTDQCCHNSPSTSPSCLSVRVVGVQKHTMLACSNYSLSHLTLFRARHYHTFLPGSGSECVASQPVPVSVADFTCSSLCLVSVLLSRTCSIYFPWKKLGQRST